MIQAARFSTRTAWIASLLLAVLFAAGLVLVLCSASLAEQLQGFLEQQVFQRSFDSGKWLPTIQSLLSYPLFCAILAAALLYLKFPPRHKVFLLCVYATGLLVMLIVCFQMNSDHYIDSDMGAEIALAKECYLQNTFWPRTWYYSTELRTLNTQLISAPLFCLTDSWHLVKTLTCTVCLPLLFWASWTLLSALGIRSRTLRLATSIISICPYSADVWQFVSLGNYYVPKIAIFYVHLSLFLTLAFGVGKNGALPPDNSGTADCAGRTAGNRPAGAEGRQTVRLAVFLVLSFIEGLTSIRYLFIIGLPLLLASVYRRTKDIAEDAATGDAAPPAWGKEIWADAKSRLAILSFAAATAGYLINSTILHRLYRFSIWYETAFGKLGDVDASTLHRDLLKLLGYNEQVSVTSPAGITNILLYCFLALLLFLTARLLLADWNACSGRQSFYIRFTLASCILTAFLYLHVKYIARYFLLELSFLPALAAIIIEGNDGAGNSGNQADSSHEGQQTRRPLQLPLQRFLLALTGSLFVLTNSFTTLAATFTNDVNDDKAGVISFLEKSGMRFGYSISPYANRLAFMMDGKIDFAIALATEVTSFGYRLPDSFQPNRFLSSSRTYEKDFHEGEECFFLINQESWELSESNKLFKEGRLVYNDGKYRIYTYPSPEAFKRSFGQ